jgi:hypothetical protein
MTNVRFQRPLVNFVRPAGHLAPCGMRCGPILFEKLQAGETLFPGIQGYEDT